jgi:hypothetical protein
MYLRGLSEPDVQLYTLMPLVGSVAVLGNSSKQQSLHELAKLDRLYMVRTNIISSRQSQDIIHFFV